jgi:transcriptional regulator of arginine metabolism
VNPSKAVRHARILHVLTYHAVRSQAELKMLLSEEGMHVTQATLSRDLVEIGAVRLRTEDGSLNYFAPGEGGERIRRAQTGMSDPFDARLAHLAQKLLIAAEASANLVLVRTPLGAAQYLASAIDHADWPSVLGTVGGDDSIIVICRDPAGGEALAVQLLRLASNDAHSGRRDAASHPSEDE